MKAIAFFVGLLLPFGLFAQSFTGKVTNDKKEPLIGASVFWLGTTVGTVTNELGEFTIPSGSDDGLLVASYVGFQSDTMEVENNIDLVFRLTESNQLNVVEVVGRQNGIVLSSMTPMKVEQITELELTKAACCDLAGCFETQGSVQPQTTNVITNSKELRILGLSGVYNQVLIDGFPMIQGLTYTYGISSIPGTLVGNVYISKGANSVVQGYESISGQINVETKEPDETDMLLLNVYVNSFLETQFNANYALVEGKWSNLTAFHTVQPAQKRDRDKDNFLDVPQLTRYSIANKWKYGKEQDWGWNSRIGLRFINEKRVGGQMDYNADTDLGSTQVYGQSVRMNQPELWTKTGYRFNDNHSLTLFASGLYQEQNSYFGTVRYTALQYNVYANLQHEFAYGNKHNLKTGVSYRHMVLSEEIGFSDTLLNRTYDGNYSKIEQIPGAFAENTMRFFNDKLTWIAGFRVDHHNKFGFKYTPRTLLKYDIAPKTIVRANVGTGWRTINLFSENIGLLVSSRDIVIADNLKPEEALNYGISAVQKFDAKDISGHFTADFYRTQFFNQIFPDYDTDATKALVNNFQGESVSNGFQLEVFLKVWKRFELKGGYSFLDVYRKINGVKQTLPFNSEHKVMVAFSYRPLTERFHFDANLHWYGRQKLPNTSSNPEEFQRPDYSRPYTVLNAQFSYSIKQFEIYVGCENLLDFRQERPIVSWDDPFGPYFDTSSVWGPTRGWELYAGIRLKIAQK